MRHDDPASFPFFLPLSPFSAGEWRKDSAQTIFFLFFFFSSCSNATPMFFPPPFSLLRRWKGFRGREAVLLSFFFRRVVGTQAVTTVILPFSPLIEDFEVLTPPLSSFLSVTIYFPPPSFSSRRFESGGGHPPPRVFVLGPPFFFFSFSLRFN